MADERLTEALKIRDVMEVLIASEGWVMLDKVLEEKEWHMLGAMRDPGLEISDITLREHRMALINLAVVRAIPAAMLADATETIAQFADTEEEEDNPNGEEEYPV